MVFQSTRPVRGATSKFVERADPDRPFQSTRPVRGATLGVDRNGVLRVISIHAPREGRDVELLAKMSRSSYFNPRAP